MQDSAKYLIHAQITANGVVERSDVVGAIFGQTEGLLGDELEIRELQESAKLGRIDVQIDAEGGQSHGEVTIASGLDRVETAILAASLETIERVGPCRATFEVTDLEDVRQAKRRAVVERATELLQAFDESVLSSQEIVEEVRRQARVERITDYEGFPAGPRVADSDAIIVVEGRADVLQLLQYGIKNAVAVEGTNVPEAIAHLTNERTVTAFLDGDRGGELILRELAQVGDVDYVAFAPEGLSVENLSRERVMNALRQKAEYSDVVETEDEDSEGVSLTIEARSAADSNADAVSTDEMTQGYDDESATKQPPRDAATGDTSREETKDAAADSAPATGGQSQETAVRATNPDSSAEPSQSEMADSGTTDSGTTDSGTDEDGIGHAAATVTETPETDGEPEPQSDDAETDDRPLTLSDHVTNVIEDGSGQARLLDEGLNPLAEGDAGAVFDAIAEADQAPTTVVVDGPVDQRVLDVAAQRGVGRVVATEEGQFVKQPTAVTLQIVS